MGAIDKAFDIAGAKSFGIGNGWFMARVTGNLSKTKNALVNAFKYSPENIMRHYGEVGVERLREATPVESGTTAASWSYQVVKEKNQIKLVFSNSNVHESCNVAYLLQMGHGTRQGTYVPGTDYINPALKPIFDDIAMGIFEEVANI